MLIVIREILLIFLREYDNYVVQDTIQPFFLFIWKEKTNSFINIAELKRAYVHWRTI